jgi:hypothetical protein
MQSPPTKIICGYGRLLSNFICMLKYKFQFNGDVDSCLALASMFKDKWELDGVQQIQQEDGYSWILLVNYYK